jgi:LmbE family N-acetylglucosaminyl deacetylase
MNAFPYCQKYISFEANVFVDISQQVKAKRKAIEVYKNVNPRWADDVESMSKFRGSFINKQHAEVFKADTILF